MRSSILRGSKLSKVMLLFLLLTSERAFSCQYQAYDPMLYFASYADKKAQGYRATQLGEPGAVLVNGCNEKGSPKFLMIGIAPERQGADFLNEISFSAELNDPRCSIENSPLSKTKPFSESRAEYEAASRLLNSCMEWDVQDSSGLPILTPPAQPGCTLKRISASHYKMSGAGFCFFKPSVGNQIEIRGIVKKDCTDRSFLAKNQLNPQDVPAKINLYIADDATGHSKAVEQFGQVEARFTLSAGPELLSRTDDFGVDSPQWPNVWSLEPHLGQFVWSLNSEYDSRFTLPFVVANNCKEKCVDSLCSSPCKFSQPLAAEVTLSQVLPSGRLVYLDSWYHGGVIFPGSTGIMEGLERQMNAIAPEVGGSYELSVKFGDPTEDYILLQKRFAQILIDLRLTNVIPGRDKLPEMGGIGTLVPLKPMPRIPWVGDSVNSDPIDNILKTMSALLNYSLWPPYYVKVCDPELQSCRSVSRKDNLEFVARFKVAGISGDVAQLSDVEVARKSGSGLVKPYQLKPFLPPTLKCEGVFVDPNTPVPE